MFGLSVWAAGLRDLHGCRSAMNPQKYGPKNPHKHLWDPYVYVVFFGPPKTRFLLVSWSL